jgi:anti-sigma factor RsiW
MKPCMKNRKRITWLVLGELEAPEQKNLRAHLAECAGCRGYFEEMSGLAGALTNAESHEGFQAGERFHQRVVNKLRAEATPPSLAGFLPQFRWTHFNWRWGLYAAGTVAVAVIAIFVFLRPASTPVTRPSIQEVASGPHAQINMEPTLSNYEMAAKLSSERFDEFLNEQGNKSLSPTPVYRAVALPWTTGAD